MKLEKR